MRGQRFGAAPLAGVAAKATRSSAVPSGVGTEQRPRRRASS